jgi:hypothetical protein
MKLYVLTRGEYSDYHIVGIYTDETLLESAKNLFLDVDVEEWESNLVPAAPVGLLPYRVEMNKAGDIIKIDRETVDGFADDLENRTWYPSRKKAIHFFMWAKDEKHAAKIAGEKRIKLLALNLWIQDWKEWGDKVFDHRFDTMKDVK